MNHSKSKNTKSKKCLVKTRVHKNKNTPSETISVHFIGYSVVQNNVQRKFYRKGNMKFYCLSTKVKFNYEI